MMEELYANEDSQMDDLRGDSYEERVFSGGSEEELENEQKLYDFQRTIEKLRLAFKEKQQKKKEGVENAEKD
jgi:hypothetical protein